LDSRAGGNPKTKNIKIHKFHFAYKKLNVETISLILSFRGVRSTTWQSTLSVIPAQAGIQTAVIASNPEYFFQFLFISQSLKPLRPSFLNKQERGKELATLVVSS
jgi:hypothetical protein